MISNNIDENEIRRKQGFLWIFRKPTKWVSYLYLESETVKSQKPFQITPFRPTSARAKQRALISHARRERGRPAKLARAELLVEDQRRMVRVSAALKGPDARSILVTGPSALRFTPEALNRPLMRPLFAREMR